MQFSLVAARHGLFNLPGVDRLFQSRSLGLAAPYYQHVAILKSMRKGHEGSILKRARSGTTLDLKRGTVVALFIVRSGSYRLNPSKLRQAGRVEPPKNSLAICWPIYR